LNRNLLSGLVIGVFVGFLAGYFLGARNSNDEAPVVAAAAAQPGAGPAMPPRPNPMEIQERILANLAAVAADPKNLQAWIQLGNDYFDTQQAQKSVDAYAKALALAPGNPDVITDQGVMYRQLKAFDKAIANFTKANQLRPNHLQSLYNLGLVYADDLKQPEPARKAWNRVIQLDPASQQAALARQGLAALPPGKP
jgi:cytochrome c-type biogenesis protein CcmH/NrfG